MAHRILIEKNMEMLTVTCQYYVNDMSPGDKLSLKGKLFELQKKLNIIDIENKRKDEFSFKPTILSYDLPEREGNVLECIKKAEIIRKQRKELLRASVQSHSEEGCTFSPKFVSKPTKNVLSEKRPVHERLTEKGKEYNANIIKKRVDIKKHDFDGKPLFVPTFMNKDRRPGTAWSNGTGKGTGNGPPNPDDFLLPEHGSYDNHHYQQHNYSRDISPPPPPPSSHHSPKHQPSQNHQQQQQFHSSQYSTPVSNTTQNFTPQSRLHIDSGVNQSGMNQSGNNLSNFVGGNVTSGLYLNNVSADEFLYQDAKDREERFRLRATEAQEEVLQIANKSKVNSTSYLVLKKKAEREVNTVLKFLDPQVTGEIGYEAIRRGSQLLLSRRKILSADQVESITLQVFNVFDFEKVGMIRFAHFSTIALPLLFHQMMNAALQDIRQNTALGVASSQNSAVSGAESVESGGVRFTATMDELQTVKNWLSQLVPIITSLEGRDTKPKADKQPEAVSFAPKINNYSLKLAARKEQKEKQQLAEILNSHPNQLNSHLNSQRNNDSSMLDDGDNSTHFDGNSILDTTFDPQLTAQSRLSSADTAMMTSREQANTAGTSLSASFQETLEVRNKLALIKKKQLVEQVTAAKLADCTFQPNIPHKRNLQRVSSRNNNTTGDEHNNNNSNNNILSGGENEAKLTSSEGDSAKQATTIYDRLYLQKRDFKATSSSDVSSYIIDELKYCTFQPQLATHNTPNTSAASTKSVKDIEGFEKSVARIRTVQEERQKAKELEETAHIREDEKYQKSRLLAKQGAVPFKSNLQERRVQQLQEAQQHRGQKAPRLYIDVKLSATKTAKIPICDFDVPYENALKFSKIYSLDANMTQILTTVIEQSMQKNNVPITVTHALEDLSTLQQDEDEESLPSSEEESSGSEEGNDEEDEDGTLHTSLTNEDNVESESVDDSSERSNALTPAAAVQYAQSMGIGVHNSRQLGSRSMDRSDEDDRGSSDNSVASSELDEEDEESRTASPYSRRLSPGGPAYGNR